MDSCDLKVMTSLAESAKFDLTLRNEPLKLGSWQELSRLTDKTPGLIPPEPGRKAAAAAPDLGHAAELQVVSDSAWDRAAVRGSCVAFLVRLGNCETNNNSR